MDHEDDSQPVSNDRVQESDTVFHPACDSGKTPDLSKKTHNILFFPACGVIG